MDKSILSKKLKLFFITKYNDASRHKIKNLTPIKSEDNKESYSFTLECFHKKEPYKLKFILHLFLGEKANKKVYSEAEELKKLEKKDNSTPKILFFGIADEFFDNPYLIIDYINE